MSHPKVENIRLISYPYFRIYENRLPHSNGISYVILHIGGFTHNIICFQISSNDSRDISKYVEASIKSLQNGSQLNF